MAEDIPRHDLRGVLAATRWLLAVHGQADEVVPVEQAHLAYHLAAQPKDILLLPGADHRLTRATDQERATARTLQWLERRLGG